MEVGGASCKAVLEDRSLWELEAKDFDFASNLK
jgi:hypothetical protein